MGPIDSAAVVETSVGEERTGENEGLTADERTVDEEQGLRRDGGLVAKGSHAIGIGGVKQREDVGEHVSHCRKIEAPLRERRVNGIVDGEPVRLDHRPDLLGFLQEHPCALVTPWHPVEAATRREDRVAKLLGGEPPASHRGDRPPVGISLAERRRSCSPAVGGRIEDEAMEGLDTPARFDEPASEPIEELGVRGGLAAGAKVVARRHEPTAKMLLPDPVDHDPRRERVLLTGDPAGEFDPAAAAGSDERTGMFSILPVLRTDGGRAEKARDVARGDRPELKTIPAKVDAEVAGEGLFRGHDHDRVATVASRHQILPPHRGVADLVLERLGAAKDPGQSVVVGGANAIELVVVAAGTGEREAEEGPAGDIDLVIDDVESRLLLVGLGERLRADHQEACGNRPRGIGGGVAARGKEIAGELFDEEAVVGEIAVAGVDDPVAVAPGLRHYGVGIVGRGLGEANDVEPVAGLLLAVMGRGEEPVDDLAPSIGPGVGEEGGGLLRRRREPGEVEGHPPQERGSIGLGHRWHSEGLDLRRKEAIDRRWGGVTAGRRRGRIDEPLVGPVGPLGGGVG